MVPPVTDAKLLAQLNASGPVTDPALLAQLNGRRSTDKPASAKIDPAEGMSWGEGALVGAGAAVDRTMRGLSGLIRSGVEAIGGKFDEPRDTAGAEDAVLYQANKPRGATFGEIGADVAMSALPVAKLAKALAASRALKLTGSAAPVLADVAANTGYAAATNPENRGLAAALGAGGAAGAHSVLKLARGATPGPKAQHLIDSGIQPTFGQVVGETSGMIGRGVRSAEAALEHLPFVGGMITKNRAAQRDAFQNVTSTEARQLPLALDYSPREMIKASQRIGEPVPRIAQVAEDVMGSLPTEPHLRTSLGGAAALAGAGMYMPKVTIPAALGVTAYALPTTQRALTGQTVPQKAIRDFVLLHPELAHLSHEAIVQIMRSVSTQGAQ